MLTKNNFVEKKNNRYLFKEEYLKNRHKDFYDDFIFFIDENYLNQLPTEQKLYHYIFNVKSIPKCECGKEVSFKGFNKGYRQFCSIKCASSSDLIKEKIKNVFIEKYGVDNPMKVSDIKNKGIKTNLEKYGVDNPIKSEIIKEKIKKTNELKYGFDNPFKDPSIKEKIKQTNLEKYGFNNPSKDPAIKEKIKQINLEKYGVDNFVKTNEYKIIMDGVKKDRIKKQLSDNNSILIEKLDSSKLLSHCNVCNKNFNISRELLSLRSSRGHTVCTNCNPINVKTVSSYEKELCDLLKNCGLTFETNKRGFIDNYELDVYIPSHNLAIEINGLYWHSELYKDKNYHLNKTIECNKKGVKLLHIFEDEWLFKKDIVLSIIYNHLNISKHKIYGRNCEIKEINTENVKKFLEKNHIQGYIPSKIKLGLYNKKELVSIMTFGSLRKSLGSKHKEGDYEMLRFCNNLNTNVVGGASKLFKYFIKNNHPNNVMSYSDKRYFTGSLYEKLGFTKKHETNPNYWYFKNYIRYHRFKYRKDVLIKEGYDKDKTEHKIMLDRNMYRIYDCGNTFWLFSNIYI
jgi:very-short-patch-repair endonuclease